MSSTPTDGFEVPVHQSLVDPILVGGLPRTVAFILWTTTAALVLGMHSWYILPVALVIFFILHRMTREDPYFFDVFRRAWIQPPQLDP